MTMSTEDVRTESVATVTMINDAIEMMIVVILGTTTGESTGVIEMMISDETSETDEREMMMFDVKTVTGDKTTIAMMTGTTDAIGDKTTIVMMTGTTELLDETETRISEEKTETGEEIRIEMTREDERTETGEIVKEMMNEGERTEMVPVARTEMLMPAERGEREMLTTIETTTTETIETTETTETTLK